MKKYIILHLSLILLVFIACTDDQKQDDKNITFQRSDFKVRKSLSGKTIEFDSLILRPSQIQLFDSFLVTCNQGAEKQFHIFNLNTAHKEGECIPVGQGPKEMMTPCFVNRNDSVVIFDMIHLLYPGIYQWKRTGIRQPYLPRYKTAMEQYSKLGQRVLRRILSRDESWIPF